ncbi:hypothetical protein TeGR_g9304 [Tetraparma gracilis]|uniref:AB hydrolase-1 domain-containing protein n=1 Tax=Tetraparma gracilis TaxID=2962635 RepID=A0ABQ6N2F0_9STRA|nr:hypothetical protein TeGR_g9304 [Tetraparma gracilis]
MDFPGHGRSGHKSPDSPHLLADYVFYVLEFVRHVSALHPGAPPSLLGHSMGAGVACLFSACYPSLVSKLVLLEGTGPLARDVDPVGHVRANADKRAESNGALFGAGVRPRLYASLDAAVDARVQTAQRMPGEQYISREAAAAIVGGGSREVAGGVEFTHDKRLSWPSASYFSEEEVREIAAAVEAPALVVKARDGWPAGKDAAERAARIGAFRNARVEEVGGSHHCHADPGTAGEVAEVVGRPVYY